MNGIVKNKLAKEILLLRNRFEKLTKEKEKSIARKKLMDNKIGAIK